MTPSRSPRWSSEKGLRGAIRASSETKEEGPRAKSRVVSSKETKWEGEGGPFEPLSERETTPEEEKNRHWTAKSDDFYLEIWYDEI